MELWCRHQRSEYEDLSSPDVKMNQGKHGGSDPHDVRYISDKTGMRLNRSDRTEKWRVAVVIAVVALHLFAGRLFLTATQIRTVVPHPERATPLTFLYFRERPPPPPVLSSSRAIKEAVNRTPPPRPPTIIAPNIDNAITVPPVNWDAEADAGVQELLDHDEQLRQHRNLAGPSDSQLQRAREIAPITSEHHEPGNSERSEGGEVITWENDKCYFTNHGTTTFGPPQTSRVCKDPPKPETELFKDMQKSLDDRVTNRTP